MANLLDDTTLEDGKYGYKNLDICNEIGFLKINTGDPDALQNCGYSPALHVIDTLLVDDPHTYSTIYGKDSTFVYSYSADYIGLLSDSSLDDQKKYELDFQLRKGETSSSPNITLMGKAVLLDQRGRVIAVERLNNLRYGVSTSIPNFGKDVKEVVVVACAAEDQSAKVMLG